MAIKQFRLDKGNAKFLGVCSGIANYFNIDATIVRVGAVIVTLLGAAPWTFIAYALAAWLVKSEGARASVDEGAGAVRYSTKDLNLNMRDIDRRMAEVEAFVTRPNANLASEIEKLR